jgi:cytoskeletal protein CcmA (bactofilin family)
MVFQTRGRRLLALSGAALIASTLACGRSEKPQNEVTRLGEDVIASGSTPTVMDSVPGDAILAGGDASFGGVTGGDYLGAGGKQAITGRIHGSLRAVAGQIHVAAAIDRNATIVAGFVELDSAAIIARNAYIVGGTIQVNGTVQEGILAYGGAITLDGVVGRDVQVAGGTLRVGPHARIAGNLRYRVPAGKVHIDPAAHITGTVTALPVSNRGALWRVLWVLGFLLVGAVVVALFPRFMAEAAEILPDHPVRAALVGLGWGILVPIAIVIAAITVVGLPLAFLTAAVYVVVVCVASVPFAVWLGRLLLGARARGGLEGTLVNFVVGGFFLLVAGIIPVVGGWVSLIAGVLGLGTILLEAQTLRANYGQPTAPVRQPL